MAWACDLSGGRGTVRPGDSRKDGTRRTPTDGRGASRTIRYEAMNSGARGERADRGDSMEDRAAVTGPAGRWSSSVLASREPGYRLDRPDDRKGGRPIPGLPATPRGSTRSSPSTRVGPDRQAGPAASIPSLLIPNRSAPSPTIRAENRLFEAATPRLLRPPKAQNPIPRASSLAPADPPQPNADPRSPRGPTFSTPPAKGYRRPRLKDCLVPNCKQARLRCDPRNHCYRIPVGLGVAHRGSPLG